MSHKSNFISTRIDNTLHQQVQTYLDKHSVSMSDFLRTAIENMLLIEITDSAQPITNRTQALSVLESQLAAKDTIIEQLQSENAHLREQENHLTQVIAMSQKNIGALTEQLDDSRQLIEDMRQRRTVWQRLKGVFVSETG